MKILSSSKRFTKEIVLVILLVYLCFLCGCSGCCSARSNDSFKIVNKIHNNAWVDKSGKVPVVYADQYYFIVSRTNMYGKSEVHTQQTSSNLYYTVKIGEIWKKN